MRELEDLERHWTQLPALSSPMRELELAAMRKLELLE